MARACPSCHAPLADRPLGGVRVDVCGDCGGTWFDREELRSVRRRRSGARREVPTIAVPTGRTLGHACPVCGPPQMQEVAINRARVERCPRCLGFWLGTEQLDRFLLEWRGKRCRNRKRKREEEEARRQGLLVVALFAVSSVH